MKRGKYLLNNENLILLKGKDIIKRENSISTKKIKEISCLLINFSLFNKELDWDVTNVCMSVKGKIKILGSVW